MYHTIEISVNKKKKIDSVVILEHFKLDNGLTIIGYSFVEF